MRRWSTGIVVGVACLAGAAAATEPATLGSGPTAETLGTGFAFGPAGGLLQANGVVLSVRSSFIGVEVGGGYQPLLITYEHERPSGYWEPEIELLHALEVDADLLVHLMTAGDETPMGFRPGYRYSTVLGHGFALAGYAFRRVWDCCGLEVSYGLALYPRAEDELVGDELPDGARTTLPWLQGGISAAVLVYP